MSAARTLLAIAITLCASSARADAIPPPPEWHCLPGTELAQGHGGDSCVPTDCSHEGTNGVCPEGLVCAEAVALFPEPGAPPPYPEMRPVADDCACDGQRCVRARWCVPPDAAMYECPSHPPPSQPPGGAGASCATSPARGAPLLALIPLALIATRIGRRTRR